MSPPRTASIKTESLGTSTIPATAGATSVTTPPRPYPGTSGDSHATRDAAQGRGAKSRLLSERAPRDPSLSGPRAILRGFVAQVREGHLEELSVPRGGLHELTGGSAHVLQEERRGGVGAACVDAVTAGVVTLLVVRPVRDRRAADAQFVELGTVQYRLAHAGVIRAVVL